MSRINKLKECGVVVSQCIINYAEVYWVTDASLSLHYIVSSSSSKDFKIISSFKLQRLQIFFFFFVNVLETQEEMLYLWTYSTKIRDSYSEFRVGLIWQLLYFADCAHKS